MHRIVLEACLPWLLLIVAAVACLFLLAHISGARMEFARLRRLHACQKGSVQSLSFVLTLPLFIMIVMFIVQVSQLMGAITVVHYAAFAAARAAVVWVPANVSTASLSAFMFDPGIPGTLWSPVNSGEPANVLLVPNPRSQQTAYTFGSTPGSNAGAGTMPIGIETPPQYWKVRKIWNAACMACAPIAPSRKLFNETVTSTISPTMSQLYATMVPSSTSNPKISQRLQNKLAYSAKNTFIEIDGIDKDGATVGGNRSYNPWQAGNPNGPFWNPFELGWEDPLTVTVTHNFALLPGPGRWLIAKLANANGTPDRVSGTIQVQNGDTNEKMYYTVLTASATLSNEGFKSVMPYVQPVP